VYVGCTKAGQDRLITHGGYGDNKSVFVKVCEHRFALP